jgi:type II restriction enzyme
MSTCPPLAVDRLIGLAGVPGNLVRSLEKGKLPARMERVTQNKGLRKISAIIRKMADPDIFVWLARDKQPTKREIYRAASVVADRLCGAVANPIIRNAQEQRQLKKVASWLRARGYREARGDERTGFLAMPSGTFGFHVNVSAKLEDGSRRVNIPIDVVIAPRGAGPRQLPLLLEAKSAGDFTNVNKRRKEEATKVAQLRATYGRRVKFVLFLCGYFDTGYLGYEAGEGIDWVWEHRVNDLARFGL